MDNNEALEHLAAIRRIMESATRLTVLPGQAAIAGGALALAGCAATYALMKSLDFGTMSAMTPERRGALIALWIGLAVIAIGMDIVLTIWLARKRGVSPWSRLAQLAAYAMAPGLGAAVALTVALGMRSEWGMVPAVWMILYGGAVWMAGVLSVHAPRLLGLAFFAAGVITLFWTAPIALVMIALTFGAANIAYGAYLLKRFRT